MPKLHSYNSQIYQTKGTRVLVRNEAGEQYQRAKFINFNTGSPDPDKIFFCELENGVRKCFTECLMHYSETT